MASAPVRDPLADHLLTPQNAALLLIGNQPAPLAGARSMDQALPVKNAVSTVRTTKTSSWWGAATRQARRSSGSSGTRGRSRCWSAAATSARRCRSTSSTR
jgi:hypothetical protein